MDICKTLNNGGRITNGRSKGIDLIGGRTMKPSRTGYFYYMNEKVLVLNNYFDGLYFMWDGQKKIVDGTKDKDWNSLKRW